MAIVMISSLYQGGRRDLARTLADKTGWPVLSREDLLEKARDMGIRVGRLETAMVKAPALHEKLGREKDLYLALVTASLCEKAREGDLIYHGRAGHMLLPGVSHRLRVGLSAPMDVRVERTARVLNLTPEKAETYLAQLDEDVNRWTHFIYRSDGRCPEMFDISFNLGTIGLSNVAGILCSMTALPDFQSTPAAEKLLADLHLSSLAKLRLFLDERTARTDLQVHADNGVLTVTYPPHQESVSDNIPVVVGELEGCRKIQCTMAETNILWVQERFAPESDNFNHILQLAQRWGAAVELLRLVPPGESAPGAAGSQDNQDEAFGRQSCDFADNGGVEDDGPEPSLDDGGLSETQDALVRLGRSGGRHTVCGGPKAILENVQGNGKYALVAIGSLFLAKGHSTRTRLTREFVMNLRDRLKAPIITVDELKERFLFGKRQAVSLIGFLALVIVVYSLVFTHQDQVLAFLSGPFHQKIKWLAPLLVALFVPVIAFIYGTVAGLALKLINID